jgi:hypothetical protein
MILHSLSQDLPLSFTYTQLRVVFSVQWYLALGEQS